LLPSHIDPVHQPPSCSRHSRTLPAPLSRVQAWLWTLETQGVSVGRRRYVRVILRTALNTAIGWRLVTVNAARLIDAPRTTSRETSTDSDCRLARSQTNVQSPAQHMHVCNGRSNDAEAQRDRRGGGGPHRSGHAALVVACRRFRGRRQSSRRSAPIHPRRPQVRHQRACWNPTHATLGTLARCGGDRAVISPPGAPSIDTDSGGTQWPGPQSRRSHRRPRS
jgi:hypothetical protein